MTIAVLTYRRPADLEAVLPLLVREAASVVDLGVRATVLVIDNDSDESARHRVEAFANQAVPIRYVCEPVPGISAARNRALDSAGTDLLAFIDDDERPSAGWLRLLLETRTAYDADVVQGPVMSTFDTPPDQWIVDGGFFNRRRMPTGTMLEVAVTNNLLLDLRVVEGLGLRFDVKLGTTGGEDTLFTRLLFRAGVRMVWCDEAGVTDVVPSSRTTRRWVTLRALSMGNASALVALRLCDGPLERIVERITLSLQGLARIVAGGTRVLIGRLARSDAQEARGTRTLLRGAGMAAGAWGYAYHEYRRPD